MESDGQNRDAQDSDTKLAFTSSDSVPLSIKQEDCMDDLCDRDGVKNQWTKVLGQAF